MRADIDRAATEAERLQRQTDRDALAATEGPAPELAGDLAQVMRRDAQAIERDPHLYERRQDGEALRLLVLADRLDLPQDCTTKE